MNLTDKFSKTSEKIANAMGHPVSFLFAVILVVGWTATGPHFHWSDPHMLFINTVTTIVTFLMGFLILNVANRSGKAEQLKLDELIRAVETANNNFMRLEEKTSEEILDAEMKIRKEAELIGDNSE